MRSCLEPAHAVMEMHPWVPAPLPHGREDEVDILKKETTTTLT